jgi:hypothetical protein
MKKKFLLIGGVLLLAVMFTLAGCDTGTGGNGLNGDGPYDNGPGYNGTYTGSTWPTSYLGTFDLSGLPKPSGISNISYTKWDAGYYAANAGYTDVIVLSFTGNTASFTSLKTFLDGKATGEGAEGGGSAVYSWTWSNHNILITSDGTVVSIIAWNT